MQDTANDDETNKNKFKKPLRPGDISVMYDSTWQKKRNRTESQSDIQCHGCEYWKSC